jgi:hypothetical protein
MRNPFVKEGYRGVWIAAAATGLLAAGAGAWYYIKQKAASRKKHFEEATAYLKPAPLLAKKKTDLHELYTIMPVN